MPSENDGDRPVIATPLWDANILVGRQPGITSACRQTRVESLAMFYHNNTFYAWIDRLNFKPLIRWVQCITSGTSSPNVRVEVRMMHKMSCMRSLEELIIPWSELKLETINVEIRSAYAFQQVYNEQICHAVTLAMRLGEWYKAKGYMSGTWENVLWQWRTQCAANCKWFPHPSEVCSVEAALEYGDSTADGQEDHSATKA